MFGVGALVPCDGAWMEGASFPSQSNRSRPGRADMGWVTSSTEAFCEMAAAVTTKYFAQNSAEDHLNASWQCHQSWHDLDTGLLEEARGSLWFQTLFTTKLRHSKLFTWEFVLFLPHLRNHLFFPQIAASYRGSYFSMDGFRIAEIGCRCRLVSQACLPS